MPEIVEVLELPLFPLNIVLFPGQLLPLHIFEERYRLMMRHCLAGDTPFGVVLIRQGQEEGETAQPHAVGTVARIVESTRLPDGALNIVAIGTERFRIQHLFFDQPYLRGAVQPISLTDPADPATVGRLTDEVRAQVLRYIELVARAAGLKIQVDAMPTSAQQVGYLAAVAMQIENREKQALLEADSLTAILTSERSLLRRELALLTWMAEHRDWPESAQFGFSNMLLPN